MMSNVTLPAPGTVTQLTPLRLDVAAKLAFPDGSLPASALRRMITAGKLEGEFIAGKWFTTLSAVERMRSRCRVSAKDRTSTSSNTPMGESSGSFVTTEGNKQKALDAMNMTAKLLIESLRPSSLRNTSRKKPSAKVIQIKPK